MYSRNQAEDIEAKKRKAEVIWIDLPRVGRCSLVNKPEFICKDHTLHEQTREAVVN